jgi:hypothetical protein
MNKSPAKSKVKTVARGVSASHEKNLTKRKRRRPALVAPPSKIDALIQLVNFVPKCLRRDSKDPNPPSALMHGKLHILEYWDWKNDEGTLGRVWYFYVLSDALPIQLQAFILYDDDGRHVPLANLPDLAPLFDPNHLQPYTNINLLGRSVSDLEHIVHEAKERIEVESSEVEKKSEVARILSNMRSVYQIGESRFSASGLYNLMKRARQRLLFALAAEEILDALSSPDTQERLNSARYFDQCGATRSHLYLSDGEIKLYPPTLFWFVNGVDGKRVRRCSVCDNYFWAGRADKKFCSDTCNATNRKRNERKRYHATGKYNRYLKEAAAR